MIYDQPPITEPVRDPVAYACLAVTSGAKIVVQEFCGGPSIRIGEYATLMINFHSRHELARLGVEIGAYLARERHAAP